jgi:hypothetical protein
MGKRSASRRTAAITPLPATPARPAAEQVLIPRLRRYSLAVFLALTAIGSLRIAATYHVYNHTFDEPASIACGMEWLSKGVYRYEPAHPPLARVATALGPYLAGSRSLDTPDMWEEGMAIFYHGGHYARTVALSRLGILPFFWIASLVVYLWAKKYFGEPTAAFTVLLYTFVPPVLAHSGMATTDMPVAAMIGASFLAALFWLERPSPLRTAVFGCSTGLAVLMKFSALPFIPAAFAAALAWYLAVERPKPAALLLAGKTRIVPLCGAIVAGALTIWAGYRFSFGPVPFASFRLPAPELYAGIQQVIEHNRIGDPAYLLGRHSHFGWWYYYPVMLAVKTPLPFLALLFYGAAIGWRGRAWRGAWLGLAFSLGILLFSTTSNIDLGVRYILAIYIGGSVVAAAGAARLLEKSGQSRASGWILGALLLWMAATSALSHPDYLPYFNALAGGHPEEIAADSDLDWGQDVQRLGDRLRELGARHVAFTPFGHLDLAQHGFPAVEPNNPITPSPGWNAVSVTILKDDRFGLEGNRPDMKLWPDKIEPREKIGKGIWLWYFPEGSRP